MTEIQVNKINTVMKQKNDFYLMDRATVLKKKLQLSKGWLDQRQASFADLPMKV